MLLLQPLKQLLWSNSGCCYILSLKQLLIPIILADHAATYQGPFLAFVIFCPSSTVFWRSHAVAPETSV